MSKASNKLDRRENELKAQLETARENGDQKAVERISGFLSNVSKKREQTKGYIKESKKKTREDHKERRNGIDESEDKTREDHIVKKKRGGDKAIDEEVEEDKALREGIYDELVRRKCI